MGEKGRDPTRPVQAHLPWVLLAAQSRVASPWSLAGAVCAGGHVPPHSFVRSLTGPADGPWGGSRDPPCRHWEATCSARLRGLQGSTRMPGRGLHQQARRVGEGVARGGPETGRRGPTALGGLCWGWDSSPCLVPVDAPPPSQRSSTCTSATTAPACGSGPSRSCMSTSQPMTASPSTSASARSAPLAHWLSGPGVGEDWGRVAQRLVSMELGVGVSLEVRSPTGGCHTFTWDLGL